MKTKSPLNSKQSLYFLWSTILNQSQSANLTLEKTLELFKRLGLDSFTPKVLLEITYQKILAEVSKKPAIHRFQKNMSKNLYLSIQTIAEKYENDPRKIFENLSSFSQLKKRLKEFRGIGDHKADVAIDIFKSFIQKDNVIINQTNNCQSLLLTLDKEIQILNSLREQ